MPALQTLNQQDILICLVLDEYLLSAYVSQVPCVAVSIRRGGGASQGFLHISIGSDGGAAGGHRGPGSAW